MKVQAILFYRSQWSLKNAKQFLKDANINYISYRITKNYYRFRLITPHYTNNEYRIKRNYNNIPSIDYIMEYND